MMICSLKILCFAVDAACVCLMQCPPSRNPPDSIHCPLPIPAIPAAAMSCLCSCDGSCCSWQHGRPGRGRGTKQMVVADMTVLVAERAHKTCRGTLESAGFVNGGLRCPLGPRPPYLLAHHCASRCSLVCSTAGSTPQCHLRRGPSKLSVRCQLLHWEPAD